MAEFDSLHGYVEIGIDGFTELWGSQTRFQCLSSLNGHESKAAAEVDSAV